jgi:cysteinyl-tRNA synthetase
VRFFILSSHYRSPLNYSDEQLNEAHSALTRLYTALRGVEISDTSLLLTDAIERFKQAMDDDFNTPVALSVLFDLARDLNKAKSHEPDNIAALANTLKTLARLLGILQDNPDSFLKGDNDDDAIIEQQIQARIFAKKAKEWATADKIRNDLKAQGIILEDSPDGNTSWRRE